MAAIDRTLELEVRILTANGQCIGTRSKVSTITDIAGTCQGTDGKTLAVGTECIVFGET